MTNQVKCPVCNGQGHVHEFSEYIGELCDHCNGTGEIDIPMTNADRIRAMSDEELCEFLGECKFFDICQEGCDNCTYSGDCDKRLLEWLRQPAEMPKEE